MPSQLISQDPFEPMRQVIDLDSYEYLNEAYPFYIQAIEHSTTPTVFALSRQALPQLRGSSPEKVLG